MKRKKLKPVSPVRGTEYYPLNFQEFCTVLAALRVFQQERAARGGPITAIRDTPEPYIHTERADRIDQMEHFEDCEPLTDEQIDALCERINYGDDRDAKHWPKYVAAAQRLFTDAGTIEVDDCALVSQAADNPDRGETEVTKGPTHQVIDFGPGPLDQTQGYPIEGTEQECSAWITAHQEVKDGRERYALQEIPLDSIGENQ